MADNMEDLDALLNEPDEGDYDIGEADENALLADDDDEEVINSTQEQFSAEPEDDVLDLGVGEEEEDLENEEYNNYYDESIHSDQNTSNYEQDQDNSRISRFQNERETNNIQKNVTVPDSLENVKVTPISRNNNNQRGRGYRGRGRGNRGGYNNRGYQRRNYNLSHDLKNSTKVLINPHFRGNVQVNSDARLAWDANNQRMGGTMQQFNNSNNAYQQNIQPWATGRPPMNDFPLQQQPQPQQPISFNQPMGGPQVSQWGEYGYQNAPSEVKFQPMVQPLLQQPIQPPYRGNMQPTFNQMPPIQNMPIQHQNFNNYPMQNMNNSFPPQNSMVPPNQYNQPMNPPHMPYSGMPGNNPPLLPQFTVQNNYNNQNFPMQQNHPPSHVMHHQQPQHHLAQNQQNFGKKLFSRQNPQQNRKFMHHNNNQKNMINKKRNDNKFAGEPRKKKRNTDFTNLHEVTTIETPDTTSTEDRAPFDEEEDEETKKYRKMIEEQKRMREEILKQKEERRKQAAREKAGELSNMSSQQPQTITAVTTTASVPIKIVNQAQQQQNPKQIQQLSSQPNRLWLSKGQNQKKLPLQQQQQLPQQQRQKVPLMSQRIVKPLQVKDPQISSFLTNRTVVSKDSSLPNTTLVVVSNLAAGTTEVKLRNMCQGIGEVEKLTMMPSTRQASIQFKNISSAHTFFKKFQRKMVDLSLIQLELKVQT